MSHFGITAIHWNARRREVDEVLLHTVVRKETAGSFALRHGKTASAVDVAKLIASGDTVWVMTPEGPHRYKNTSRVGLRRGEHERLYSYADDGKTTSALVDLPRYRLADDPPPKEFAS